MTDTIETDLRIKKTFWVRGAFLAAVAVYVAVALSSVAIQDNAVEGCMRNGTFKNAEAANWEQASKVRAKGGDMTTSRTYTENAQVIRGTIPMDDGWKPKSSVLTRVNGGRAILVTDRGKFVSDRESGCKDAYKPLLPFNYL